MSVARPGFVAPSAARAAGRDPHAVGAWRKAWRERAGCAECAGRRENCVSLEDEPFHALVQGVQGVQGQSLLRVCARARACARGHARTHAYTRARAHALLTLLTLNKIIINKRKTPSSACRVCRGRISGPHVHIGITSRGANK